MLKLSPDEAALLKAVCADRDNDLPRLVYADWLDDHGRPERAEFIRLQVAAEQEPNGRRRWKQFREADRLKAAHGDGWLAKELPGWAVRNGCGFARGFAEGFSVPARSFAHRPADLLDRAPVRRLGLRGFLTAWPEVLGCDGLRRVPEVEFTPVKTTLADALTDGHVGELAGAGWLDGVRALLLGLGHLTDSAAQAMAGCHKLNGLRELQIHFHELTVAGTRALLDSHHLKGCYLHLTGYMPVMFDHPEVWREVEARPRPCP